MPTAAASVAAPSPTVVPALLTVPSPRLPHPAAWPSNSDWLLLVLGGVGGGALLYMATHLGSKIDALGAGLGSKFSGVGKLGALAAEAAAPGAGQPPPQAALAARVDALGARVAAMECQMAELQGAMRILKANNSVLVSALVRGQ